MRLGSIFKLSNKPEDVFNLGIGFECGSTNVKIESIFFNRKRLYGNMLVLSTNEDVKYNLFLNLLADKMQHIILLDETNDVNITGLSLYTEGLYCPQNKDSADNFINENRLINLDHQVMIKPASSLCEYSLQNVITTVKKIADNGIMLNRSVLILINKPSKKLLQFLPELMKNSGGIAKIVLIDSDYKSLFLKSNPEIMKEIDENFAIRIEASGLDQRLNHLNIGIESFAKVFEKRYALITDDFY